MFRELRGEHFPLLWIFILELDSCRPERIGLGSLLHTLIFKMFGRRFRLSGELGPRIGRLKATIYPARARDKENPVTSAGPWG